MNIKLILNHFKDVLLRFNHMKHQEPKGNLKSDTTTMLHDTRHVIPMKFHVVEKKNTEHEHIQKMFFKCLCSTSKTHHKNNFHFG